MFPPRARAHVASTPRSRARRQRKRTTPDLDESAFRRRRVARSERVARASTTRRAIRGLFDRARSRRSRRREGDARRVVSRAGVPALAATGRSVGRLLDILGVRCDL